MNNKLIALALAGLMTVSMTGCGSSGSGSSAGTSAGSSAAASSASSSVTSSSASASGSQSTETVALSEAFAEGPVLVSSAGQSADVEMVNVLLGKAGVTATVDNTVDGSDLGDYKTLVLAVGGSRKGLGAAGVDADTEIARVESLTKAADEAGLSIIAVHVGGSARRGDLSDRFIAPSFAYADYAVVVEAGDEDGMMAGLANEAGIPFAYAESMATVVEPLQAAFK